MTSFLRFAPCAFASLFLPFTVWASNPPSDPNCENSQEYRDAHPDECCNSGSGSGVGSLGHFTAFGGVSFEDGLDHGRIAIHQESPTPTIFTPQSVRYESVLGMEITEKKTSTAAWDFRLVNERRRSLLFRVPQGASTGTPFGDSAGASYSLTLLDASGNPMTAGLGNPAPDILRLNFKDGRHVELDYATNRPVRFISASGRVVDLTALPAAQTTELVRVDTVLRQIKAPAGLADFVQVADQAFEIRFYVAADVGAKDSSTGLYAVSGTAYRVIRVENAIADPADFNHVKITDTWGTRTKVDLFTYNAAVKEWQLAVGSGDQQRIESKSVTPGPRSDETTTTRLLKDGSGHTISTILEIKRKFPWGTEMVARTQEPATLNLTTTYAYHGTSGQPGYAKLKSKVYPDGFWETFAYDAQGRRIQKVTPWKDTAFADAATGARKITSYDYASLAADDIVADEDERPRTVTESGVTAVGGSPIVVKRTYYVYQQDSNGVYTEIEEQAASTEATFGASGNPRTARVHYTTNPAQPGYDALSAGRLHYEDHPDGTRVTYAYSRNSAELAAYFTVTEIRATPANPAGLDGLSTHTDRVHDVRGNVVKIESSIRSGGAWHLVSTEVRTMNDQGFQTATSVNGRQTYAAAYDADLLVSHTTEEGVTTTFTYDALGKVDTETRVGAPASGAYAAQPDISTVYLRELGGLDCGCDGEVTAFIAAGTFSQEIQYKKDALGRNTYRRDAAGMETTYAYALGGRQSTRVNADGGTVIKLSYLDRRLLSITGTGVIAAHYDYGVDPDGTRWTRVSQVAVDGPRWIKRSVNALDQLIRVEKPAFDGGTLVTSYSYDAQGHRTRVRQRHVVGSTETALIADALTNYGALGKVVRTGLDMDGNGSLDLASTDRITAVETDFEFHESAWWRVAREKVLPSDNDPTEVTVAESRERLSGFSGGLAVENVTLDVHGNTTRRKTELDFAQKIRTETTTYPDSMIAAVRVSYYGRLVAESTKTVAARTLYGYDDLGRVISLKEPRHTQASTIAYDTATGQVIARTDAAGNATTYAYYANGEAGAGWVKVTTNALGHTERVGYDLQGRMLRKWGTAAYPEAYSYTDYGELATLTTWRDVGAANIDAASWPAPAGGDVTGWSYHASTGLLIRKQYADGKGTDYTYDALGRIATRLWARSDVNGRVATAYGYDPASGSLTGIDYSDATPDVAFTYTRFGAQETVTDATGTRTLTYTAALQPSQEQLPDFFGSRILTRRYQGSGAGEMPGRGAGFELGVSGDLAQDNAVTYGFDTVGRLSSVAALTGTFTYGHFADSDLRRTVTGPTHAVTYGYEPNRDVLMSVENKVESTTVSKHDYDVNAVGQRTQRSQSGTAFVTARADTFGYNPRGELTAVTNAALPARDEAYVFDDIGNRISATVSGAATTYTANSLNQYTQVSGFSSQPSYDADGNMTATGTGQVYTWDAENRLISVEPLVASDGAQKVQNTYDMQSRRVRRQLYTYTAGIWSLSKDERYLYDGWNVVAKYAAQISGLSLQVSYTWGLDLSGTLHGAGGVGGLLAVKDGAASYYYAYDSNGNVNEVLDGTGEIVAHYEYTPFGLSFVSSGPYAVANEYRFSTKAMDSVCGLYYYGLRYYNSSTGRWINRDLLGEKGGVNLYAFCVNDSIASIDALGLSTVSGTVSFTFNGTTRTAEITVEYTASCSEGGPSISVDSVAGNIVGVADSQSWPLIVATVDIEWTFPFSVNSPPDEDCPNNQRGSIKTMNVVVSVVQEVTVSAGINIPFVDLEAPLPSTSSSTTFASQTYALTKSCCCSAQ